MGKPTTLQTSFSGGMRRDISRNRMQDGSLWNAVDYIIEDGAALRGRGGWSNAASVSSVTASATQIKAGIYAPFGTPQNLCIADNGTLYKFTGVSSVTSVTACNQPKQNPVFHNNLVVIPSPDGSTAVQKYDGSAVASLGGSPPAGQYATVYKDYTLLGATSATANRTWFSSVGDPNSTWDVSAAGSWLQHSSPVRGYASLRNAVLVFHDATTTRIRGSIPPPDTDMTVDDPVFQVGIADARSIAYHGETAIWCATEGVFRSDGVALEDLSRKGGMKSYWEDLLASYSSTWTIAGGVLRDTYFICVMDGSTFKDAFAIDLTSYSWTRLSNVDALCFWQSVGILDELYWGRRGAGIVGSMASIWSPASGVKNDGDGDAVSPVLETPFYEGRPGLKQWVKGFVGIDVTDYASDNPTATVQAVWTPESISYETLATISETTAYSRERIDMNRRAHGVGFKLTRTGAGDTRVYSFEAEMYPLERSRVA